ncbi:MAG: DUF2267 domain-containing protein [Leptolyngbyaceae bacterium]|nr:DUF2267 domain-containing protein [Leptolyngbyaceae bacterium]
MTSVSSTPVDADNASVVVSQFLEKVKRGAGLEDLYDARDIAEVVFRTLRDMMTTELSDRIASELEGKLLTTGDGASQDKLVEVWKDTNLLVRLLSRIRKPLIIETDTFLFRIGQEAGLSRGVTPEAATEAVFSALKSEISAECQQEISKILTSELRQAWHAA